MIAGDLVREVVGALTRRGETLAVAESLTGGQLAATLVDVPGVSAVFRGGLIVYASDLKVSLAGVPEPLIAAHGVVDPEVAVALAEGARDRCGADWGLGTTGVAGPDPQEGVAPGTAYAACAGPGGATVVRLDVPGDRAAVRGATVAAALDLLAARLAEGRVMPAGPGSCGRRRPGTGPAPQHSHRAGSDR